MLQTVSIVLYTIYSNNLILLDIAFIADIIDDYMLPCLDNSSLFMIGAMILHSVEGNVFG